MPDYFPAWKRLGRFCRTYQCLECRRAAYDVLRNTKQLRYFRFPYEMQYVPEDRRRSRMFDPSTFGVGRPRWVAPQ